MPVSAESLGPRRSLDATENTLASSVEAADVYKRLFEIAYGDAESTVSPHNLDSSSHPTTDVQETVKVEGNGSVKGEGSTPTTSVQKNVNRRYPESSESFDGTRRASRPAASPLAREEFIREDLPAKDDEGDPGSAAAGWVSYCEAE